MSRYLKELYKKPDHRKKRFALLVSSTITLFIFGIWSLTIFGVDKKEVAVNTNSANNSTKTSSEVSPFQSLGMNLASGIEAVKSSFNELRGGFQKVDLEAEYMKLRDNSLDTYGR